MLNKVQLLIIGLGLLLILASIINPAISNIFAFYLVLSILLTNYIAKHTRLYYFVALASLASLSILLHGINLGIDFKGGTRVILQVDQQISSTDMLDLIERIKNRLSALGLEQIVVKGFENRLIYIEGSSQDLLDRIRNIITRRGEYIGIVDGQVVIRGEDIIPNTVQIVLDRAQLGGADWGVQFAITPEANMRFLEKVKGKANRPIYMFLDPPKDAYILLDREKLVNPEESLEILSYLNISVIWEDEFYLPKNGTLITSRDVGYSNQIIVDNNSLYPEVQFGSISSWKAINLISAPRLSPSITTGTSIGMRYLITGTANNRSAIDEAREIASLLRGGGIPYNLEIVGTTNIPAVFGELSLFYSIIGIVLSVLAVGIFASIRYKNLRIAGIMMFISILEIIILLAIVGRFTLDLAAVVGLIAAAGVSIDAQIIITDFRLRRRENFEYVYKIVRNNVAIAIIVMFPLLLLASVEVVGFAIIAILSYLLGYLLSRGVYNELLDKYVLKTTKHAGGGI